MWMPSMSRRHFMKHMAGFSLMAGASFEFLQKIAAAAPTMKREHKSLVVLWMSGGPTHMDTWDLKPGAPTGGEFKPIKTAASGVEISEHLPTVAKNFKNLAIVRSLVTNEGSHERGRVLMHTAYQPNPAVAFPSIGSVVCQQTTPKDLAVPGFISVNGTSEGPGFLGMAYAPFTVQNPNTPPRNINAPGPLADEKNMESLARLNARYSMLSMVEKNFMDQRKGAATAHNEILKKAYDLTNSRLKLVFDVTKENDGKPIDTKVRDEYGRNAFGDGCLMARKLVEAGVPAIEVDLGGWDNHNNIFNIQHNTTPAGGLQDRLDKGMGTLVKELEERGLMKDTVVVWMGEFGRTPRINQNNGRDHWARCWSVVVGGGGIKGGQVYGSTNEDGMEVKDKPASISDLFATVYTALGIPAETEIRDPLGRPRKIVGEKPGKALAGLV
jgi:hypothetical protein